VPLKIHKQFSDAGNATEFGRRIAHAVIFKFKQAVQLVLIQLADAFLDELREHEVDERLLLVIVPREESTLAR